MLTAQASGSSITTIEGLSDGVDLHRLQEAFWNNHGLQCAVLHSRHDYGGR